MIGHSPLEVLFVPLQSKGDAKTYRMGPLTTTGACKTAWQPRLVVNTGLLE